MACNPWCGKNVFIYSDVAFVLRFASAKQDQYPLCGMLLEPLSDAIDLQNNGRKGKCFHWEIDWRWASVVCNTVEKNTMTQTWNF